MASGYEIVKKERDIAVAGMVLALAVAERTNPDAAAAIRKAFMKKPELLKVMGRAQETE